MEGLSFEVQNRSNEVVVGTRDGVVKARTLKRLDGVQRIDVELVSEMRGPQRDPVPGNPEEVEVPLPIVPLGPARDLPVMRAGNQELERET